MKKKGKSSGFLLWTVVFAALVLLTDQILVRVALTTPGLQAIQVFYRDFRGRLFALPQTARKPAASATLPPAPRAARPAPAPATTPPPTPAAAARKPQAAAPAARSAAPAHRYVYADEDGNLQFAESLDEVPAKLRAEAKPLTN